MTRVGLGVGSGADEQAVAGRQADVVDGDATAGPALVLDQVSLRYSDRQVLDGICLEVAAGESAAVMGRSGSGKSSLLSCVLGIVKPTGGKIVVAGQVVDPGRRREVAALRRSRIGMVFQSGELLPELSPVENVMIAGLLACLGVAEARSRASDLLEALGVPPGARSVAAFSGGERQRVAVARALMNRPRLLLADEPTGSLDPQTRDQVVEVLFSVPRTFGCGLVVVTHDPVVAEHADRLLTLDDGRLREISAEVLP